MESDFDLTKEDVEDIRNDLHTRIKSFPKLSASRALQSIENKDMSFLYFPPPFLGKNKKRALHYVASEGKTFLGLFSNSEVSKRKDKKEKVKEILYSMGGNA